MQSNNHTAQNRVMQGASNTPSTLAISELDYLAVVLEDNGIDVFDSKSQSDAKSVISNLLAHHGLTHISSTDVLKQIQIEYSYFKASKDKHIHFPKDLPEAVNNQAYPLHLAVRKGDMKEVKKLLDSGLNVNQVDVFGSTPLHVACMYGHKEVAEYLILKGASLNASTYEYDMYDTFYTPLDLAVKYAPNTDTLNLLIQKGASPSNWNQVLFNILEIVYDSLESNDYSTYDLVLKKLEIIVKNDSDGLWCYVDGEDMPVSVLLETYSTRVDNPQFYNRLMDSVKYINSMDILNLAQNYIAAKNLFHAFPSDSDYVFKIDNYPAEISAQGHHSVFTTELAYRSLHAYEQTLIGKLDQVGFKNVAAMYPNSNEPILKNVESYSLAKQTIFAHVEEIYKQGMDAKHQASLYSMSEQIYRLYEAGQTVLLPCGWDGHAIDIILNKNLNLFIVANGGDSYPSIDSGINAYNHQFAISVDDIYSILTNHEKMELEFRRFYDLGLIHNDEYSLILPFQEFGNCAWYSQQLAERALIFLELKNTVNSPMLALTLSDTWFKQLDEHHQTLVLKDYLAKPYLEVSAIGDILIHYHNKLKTPEEKERAKLILDNLCSPENKTNFVKYYNTHRLEISAELKKFIKENGYKIPGMKEGDIYDSNESHVIQIDDVIKMSDSDILPSNKTAVGALPQVAQEVSLMVNPPIFHEEHPQVQLV